MISSINLRISHLSTIIATKQYRCCFDNFHSGCYTGEIVHLPISAVDASVHHSPKIYCTGKKSSYYFISSAAWASVSLFLLLQLAKKREVDINQQDEEVGFCSSSLSSFSPPSFTATAQVTFCYGISGKDVR